MAINIKTRAQNEGRRVLTFVSLFAQLLVDQGESLQISQREMNNSNLESTFSLIDVF